MNKFAKKTINPIQKKIFDLFTFFKKSSTIFVNPFMDIFLNK
jgi:hypothetical protein